MPASSKNKNNSVARLDKKSIQAAKKNKVRQETMDVSLPDPQILPNGEKPNFGNSKSRRKARDGLAPNRKSKNATKSKVAADETDAAEVTQHLKDMYLKSGEPKPKPKNSRKRQEKRNSSTTSVSSGADSSSADCARCDETSRETPVSTLSAKSVPQPTKQTSPPMTSPTQYSNSSVVSPLLMNPGLNAGINVGIISARPPSSPVSQTQFQQQQQMQQPQQPGFAGYPYGNYSFASPFNAPQFMAPQTPLMNPMYPQPSLHQLPVMYRALDIQQHQMEQNYLQQAQNHPYQSLPQNHQYPRPVSAPLGLDKVPKVLESSAITGRSKPYENQPHGSSKTFAGASFASKDPKVHKLPKPSFT